MKRLVKLTIFFQVYILYKTTWTYYVIVSANLIFFVFIFHDPMSSGVGFLAPSIAVCGSSSLFYVLAAISLGATAIRFSQHIVHAFLSKFPTCLLSQK